ncbi:MAG TPA: hypothetical protein VHL09_03055 [Dehalococcoidia bacterium]|nr:hypothetical protein [Dehalococcoidia bacterium]
MRLMHRLPIPLAIGAVIVATVGLTPSLGVPVNAQTATPVSPQPTATPRPATPPAATATAQQGTTAATATAPARGQPAGQPATSAGPVSAQIAYPPDGQIIALQPMLVQLDISGIRLDAGQLDAPSAPGVGHWLLLIDRVEVASGDAREIHLSGLPTGSHELTLQVRNNDRSPLVPPVSDTITICVEVCSPGVVAPEAPASEVPSGLPEVPGGLPRTGTGGLLAGG